MRTLSFRTISSVVMALFFLLATVATAQEPAAEIKFSTSELTIRSAGGKEHPFIVELATNDEQRARGLMFRKQMAPDHGMLFDFGQARRVTMWMENTILPLDMLFIRKDGIITHIRENAVPYSRDTIDSRHPVNFVLELNAGRTKALGIRVGDKVIGKPLGNGN
jgi:uncharacterized membrane protein (UPF0127 family)